MKTEDYIKSVEKTRDLEHHYISLLEDNDKHKFDLLKFIADALVDINAELKILNRNV